MSRSASAIGSASPRTRGGSAARPTESEAGGATRARRRRVPARGSRDGPKPIEAGERTSCQGSLSGASAQSRSALSRGARQSMFVPVSDPPAATSTGLAHVATVSFLAARAAPSMQFWIALAGGIALARAAALPGRARRLRGERGGDAPDRGGDGPGARERPADPGADRAAARRAAPPRHARAAADRRLLRDPPDALRRADRAPRSGSCSAGSTPTSGSYDTLTGWLGILPEGERGALIVTAGAQHRPRGLLHASRRCSCTAGRWPRGRRRRPRSHVRRGRAGAGPWVEALRPARDHARGGDRLRAAAERHVVGAAGERRRVAGAGVGGLALRPEALGLGLALDRAAVRQRGGGDADRRPRPRRGAATRHPRRPARAGGDLAARGGRAGRAARDVPARAVAHPRGAAGARGERDPRRPRLRRAPDRVGAHAGRRARHGRADAAPVAGVVRDWVAAEAAGFRAGAAAARAQLAAAPRDGLLVALAAVPALALFAHG